MIGYNINHSGCARLYLYCLPISPSKATSLKIKRSDKTPQPTKKREKRVIFLAFFKYLAICSNDSKQKTKNNNKPTPTQFIKPSSAALIAIKLTIFGRRRLKTKESNTKEAMEESPKTRLTLLNSFSSFFIFSILFPQLNRKDLRALL